VQALNQKKKKKLGPGRTQNRQQKKQIITTKIGKDPYKCSLGHLGGPKRNLTQTARIENQTTITNKENRWKSRGRWGFYGNTVYGGETTPKTEVL